MMGNSYWCNGPILSNVILGVDGALWNAKEKLTGMPLYSLLSGKARGGVTVYHRADRGYLEGVRECISQYIEEGYRHIHCRIGTCGGGFDGKRQRIVRPEGAPGGAYFHPKMYIDSVIRLFGQTGKDSGRGFEVIHDVHERLSLADTLALVRELEPFKLFFLEDSLALDQVGYYKYLRGQAAIPFTMGKLSANPAEWRTIIQSQWTDFIRMHLNDVGNVIPAIKLVHFRDIYSMWTAWHGSNDLSPIGVYTQIHLGLNSHNFGIQEFFGSTQEEETIFPGRPRIKDGYTYVDDTPSIGVDFDEEGAAKYPTVDTGHGWLFARLPDGATVRPWGGHYAAGFCMVNYINNRMQF